MDVFKSWLVANLEIVLYVLMPIIMIISFFISGPDYWLSLLLLSAAIFTISIVSIKNVWVSFVVIMFLIAFFLWMLLIDVSFGNEVKSLFNSLPSGIRIGLIISIISSVVFGILVAIYAYRNFDDVVSLRFLYRNSAASVFEYAWKYAFNRQFAGFMFAMGISIEIIASILLSHYMDPEDRSAFIAVKEHFKNYRDSVYAAENTYSLESDEINNDIDLFLNEIDEIDSYQEMLDQGEDNSLVTLNGILKDKDGEQRMSFAMSLFLHEQTATQDDSISGNYQFMMDGEWMKSNLKGVVNTDDSGNRRLNLFSENGTDWFDLDWGEDSSISGLFYMYLNESMKKMTVELTPSE